MPLLEGTHGRPTPRDGDGDGHVRDGTPQERALAPAHPPAAPPQLRDFGDAAALRTGIYDSVLHAAKAIRPITNTHHTLAVIDPAYEGPADFSMAAQKRAILEGGTLGRRLRATYVLTDNATGEELDRKRTTIATVPYATPRNTFIRGGIENTLGNQFRLKPGVYTRRKENGELESHVNVLPGTGASHRVFMEPETGRFRLGLGNARMPLLPLLRAMGASDRSLREAWGNDLAYANMLHSDPTVIDKLHKRLVRGDELATEPGGRQQAVADAFAAMPLDPEVTQATLGAPHAHVDLATLLAVTKKLIAVNKGEAEVDDRDNLAYMTVHGPEDLIAERLGRNRMAFGKVLWKASRDGTLKSVPPNLMTRDIESAITSSGLGQPSESINPLQIYEQQGRVSRMGEGGIPSLEGVPEESRAVNPSQFGFVDPLVTPESLRVGVDSRIASKVMKGPNGTIYSTAFRDRQGKPLSLTPAQVAGHVVAFAGELGDSWRHEGLSAPPPYVAAMVNGKTKRVPRETVDAEMTYHQSAHSPITNMIPMASAVKPQRAVMAGRMLTQALPLEDPESPHVQSGVPGEGQSYEKKNGEILGAVRSKDHGTVAAVSADGITIRRPDGSIVEHELYSHFPNNRKTFTHQTPLVHHGEAVVPGQLLARSNYTDAEGVAALGKNARVVYVPTGHNFEDAIEVSESFAQRMKSEHMYQHYLEKNDKTAVGRDLHTSVFPGKYSRALLEKFDDDGVIKPGTQVDFDHPLILAAKKRDTTYGVLHKGRKPSFTDASETWQHHAPGVVTDVAKTSKGVLVAVKTLMPTQVGDKISARYGDKGVISRITPDHEMPQDANGVPFEVAMNPLGTISRTNPAQHVEGALGKIAALTGKKYSVVDFDKAAIPDLTQYARDELARHGLNPESVEPVFDPVKQRWIKDPFTGDHPQTANRFIMKLHHTSESKNQGRGTAAYAADGTPAKGGATGSKRMSLMDLNALLSHGATAVARDAGLYRGQAQPELWSRFMAGHGMPEPKVPHVYEKFHAQLRAAGINPLKDDTKVHLMALTDHDVDQLAGDREIQNAETVDWQAGLRPIKGGLFDMALSGGHGGSRWSAVKLHEPMPNPVMEDPIRRVLGLTEQGFRDVLTGKAPLNEQTGPVAIKNALAAINVDQELARVRIEAHSNSKSHRDAAVRRWRYLESAQRLGLHPRDWVLSRVPVLPPQFRPVSVMGGSGLPLVADSNLLYQELFDANKNLADLSENVGDLSDEREAVYDSLKGVVGLGEPMHPKNRERQVRGILKHVFGDSPKQSVIQRKLLGTTTDLVGRAVITPDPDLDMDHVGIPESRAWEVYKPFIVRRLVRAGMPRLLAAQHVQGKSDMARSAMVDEMAARPVIVTRAPVLHRYGVMAFRPTLAVGETLRLPLQVYKGLGADNDGDTVTYHVPASDDAVADAYAKMLPSRNLLAVSDFRAHQLPSQEYLGGLYTASTARNDQKRAKTYATVKDALKAHARGELGVDDPVAVVMHDEPVRLRNAFPATML